MPEYRVKLGFWLRAYETLDIEADTSEGAIENARQAARAAMELMTSPEHIDLDARREGSILWIDQVGAPIDSATIAEDIEFDDDRIHPPASTNGE